MNEDFAKVILDAYFQSHHDLIDSEIAGEDTLIISFPVYYSSNHRIEVSVTRLPDGNYGLSDMGKTIAELKLAGLNVSGNTRKRIVRLASNADIRVVGDSLLTITRADNLGTALHLFADSAKTVGDAYLAHRDKIETEDELRGKVKRALIEQNYAFRELEELSGEIEKHKVDFLIPSNGRPGVALSVLPNPNRLTAEAWVFKAMDIKSTNKNLRVGIVYGAEARESPRNVLTMTKTIDIAIPSTEVNGLGLGNRHLLD